MILFCTVNGGPEYFPPVGSAEIVGFIVGAFVCPMGVGITLYVGESLGLLVDVTVGILLCVGFNVGESVGDTDGGVHSISSKHIKFFGQSLPVDPNAVGVNLPVPHSVCGEHVATATSYPPTTLGPQNFL